MWGVPDDGVYGAEPARDRAKEALQSIDADYTYDGDTLVGPAGNQVELELYYNAASPTQELAAEFYRQEFEANLGFTLNTNAIDGTTFSENYWSGSPGEGAELVETIDGQTVRWERPSPSNPGPRSVTAEEAWDMSTIFGLNTYPRNPVTNESFFDGPNSAYNPVGYYPEFDAQAVFGRNACGVGRGCRGAVFRAERGTALHYARIQREHSGLQSRGSRPDRQLRKRVRLRRMAQGVIDATNRPSQQNEPGSSIRYAPILRG